MIHLGHSAPAESIVKKVKKPDRRHHKKETENEVVRGCRKIDEEVEKVAVRMELEIPFVDFRTSFRKTNTNEENNDKDIQSVGKSSFRGEINNNNNMYYSLSR